MIIIRLVEPRKKNKNFILKWLEKTLTIISMLVILSVITLIISLALSIPIFDIKAMDSFKAYFYNLHILVLNLIPIMVTLTFLYILFNSFWISSFINTTIYIVLGFINKYKILYMDSPLKASDFKYVKEINNFLLKKNYSLSKYIPLFILLIVSISIFLKIFYDFKIDSRKNRIIILLLLIIISSILYVKYYIKDTIVYSEEIIYSQRENYIKNGFIYSFISNIDEVKEMPPKKYREKDSLKVLNSYKDHDLEKKPNIIIVLLDSFEDFTQYEDLNIDKNIYMNYKSILNNSIEGDMILGLENQEDTLNVENEIITGFKGDYSYRNNTNSFTWYFKNQGYLTEFQINEKLSAYNRDIRNLYLGFDSNTSVASKLPSESIIEGFRSARGKNKSYFNLSSIILDNIELNNEFKVNIKNLDGENSKIFNNYLNRINYIDIEIGRLVDYFEKENEPTLILFTSAGLPILGKNQSIYKDLDINIDIKTREGYLNRQKVPYVFWGNASAKELFNKSFDRQGDTINSNYLLAELFNYLDLRGSSYIEYLKDKKEICPVLNNIYFKIDEEYIRFEEAPEYIKELYDENLNIEYYYKNNFIY